MGCITHKSSLLGLLQAILILLKTEQVCLKPLIRCILAGFFVISPLPQLYHSLREVVTGVYDGPVDQTDRDDLYGDDLMGTVE